LQSYALLFHRGIHHVASGINDVTAHHRLHDMRFGDLIHRNFNHVAIEHNEVRQLARLERTRVSILVQLVGRINGDRSQCLLAAKPLVLAQPFAVLRGGSGDVGSCDANRCAAPPLRPGLRALLDLRQRAYALRTLRATLRRATD